MNGPGKQVRLGRGLGALLGDYVENPVLEGKARSLEVSSIGPNPQQPRRAFSESELEQLAESIKENGLLQPLLVRPVPGKPDRYELVAGERRLRAIRCFQSGSTSMSRKSFRAIRSSCACGNAARGSPSPAEPAPVPRQRSLTGRGWSMKRFG